MDIKYVSQAGQDKWVCEFFKFKKEGYFLDVGAYDGVDLSNTYVLEKDLNWKGICCEANSFVFKKLIFNRSCECLQVAVSDYDGTGYFVNNEMYSYLTSHGNVPVTVKTMKTILKESNAPKVIDYFSLDVEGSEPQVLKEFPFDEYEMILITVEHNKYSTGDFNKNLIKDILINNNFILAKEDVATFANPTMPLEDWYINKKYVNE
jgi:FkbM family methyltransferase